MTRLPALASLAGAAVAAALLLPGAAGAPRSPEELAFVRSESIASEIYVVAEHGNGLRRLTRNRAPDYSPIWSPDGSRILFVSSRDGDDELFVMNATGGERS